MAFVERIKGGLNYAKESFGLLWRNKILIVYSVIATLVFSLAQFLLTQLRLIPQAHADNATMISTNVDQQLFNGLFKSGYYIIPLLLIFVYSFITTFFAVRLVHHVLGILHGKNPSIKQEIISTENVGLITIWSLITTLLSVIRYVMPMEYTIGQPTAGAIAVNTLTPMTMLTHAVIFLWVFITMLVIPTIAAQKLNIIDSIKQSGRLVAHNWLEIISGGFVILALGTLAVIPLLAFSTVSPYLFVAAVWPLQCIIFTVFEIFTAIVYNAKDKKSGFFGFFKS